MFILRKFKYFSKVRLQLYFLFSKNETFNHLCSIIFILFLAEICYNFPKEENPYGLLKAYYSSGDQGILVIAAILAKLLCVVINKIFKTVQCTWYKASNL